LDLSRVEPLCAESPDSVAFQNKATKELRRCPTLESQATFTSSAHPVRFHRFWPKHLLPAQIPYLF
ncbi:MAG: hypothetical protein KDK99_03720, partial [Verrucomicrobiales bacterium]|nr:hypothetical protein [Verrucomicrobiales bacterium]